jgi:hypothetical protein
MDGLVVLLRSELCVFRLPVCRTQTVANFSIFFLSSTSRYCNVFSVYPSSITKSRQSGSKQQINLNNPYRPKWQKSEMEGGMPQSLFLPLFYIL